MKQDYAVKQAVKEVMDRQPAEDLHEINKEENAVSLLGQRIWNLMDDRFERGDLREAAGAIVQNCDDYLNDPEDFELFIFGLFAYMAWSLEDDINYEITQYRIKHGLYESDEPTEQELYDEAQRDRSAA